MSVDIIRVAPDWLDLREPADAVARSQELIEALVRHGSRSGTWTVHDLGAGSGSMGRWLAPQLRGAQHWILHDHDDDLLRIAAADPPQAAADGAPVTVQTRATRLDELCGDDLAGADLITASALLDILTKNQLNRLVDVCVETGCPVLMTLTVVGRVDLAPTDPLDVRIEAAFNDHQRRTTSGGRLLGPDACGAAAERFGASGASVSMRSSPWHLAADRTDLATQWLVGWVGAAREQDPDLDPVADAYLERRLSQARAGGLAVTVDHADLLVLPR